MAPDDSPKANASEFAAFDLVGDPRAPCPWVLTCEHASNALPEWQAGESDRVPLDDHWGWDIGAGALTRALAHRTHSVAVLSRFSRLVCDPNRDPSEPSFIVRRIEGRELSFNAELDEAEHERRCLRYAEAYHRAVDAALRARRARPEPVQLCSIHSFTPLYLGRRRAMEVGVLFDAFDEYAWRVQGALLEEGFEAALNAPYSGYDGLIYSARRHGRAHDLVYLELEVRQDLIDGDAKVAGVADRIARALERAGTAQS